MAQRPRIVIASPDLHEATALSDWLVEEGFDPVRKSSPRAALEEMQARHFDLLIADAVFAFRDGLHAANRARRPLAPTVVIDATGGSQPSESVSQQVIVLSRPLERAMVVCTISMAVLDGRPSRRSVRKSVNRFAAVANGVRAYIVDVSNEGLRLELPRDRRAVPPPCFGVRIPLIGVNIVVQRMWARSQMAGKPEVLLCGGALSPNQDRGERAWRSFVETVPIIEGRSVASLQVQ